jgi:hypothetical protein
MQELIKKRKKKGKKFREKTRKKLTMKREIVKNYKKENYFKMREERERRERKINKFRKKMVKLNKEKLVKVKRQISLGIMKKELYKKGRTIEVKNRLWKEGNMEKTQIMKMRRNLSDMCKMEEDWLVKLKSSQTVQNKAFDKLKQVLNVETNENELKQESQRLSTNLSVDEEDFEVERKLNLISRDSFNSNGSRTSNDESPKKKP